MSRYSSDGAHKAKHGGTKDEAEYVFDPAYNALVGKCPADFNLRVAQELLDKGIVRAQKRGKTKPLIFNVYEGVPYRAHGALGQDSYHGFPEVPRNIPPDVQTELRIRARKAGDEAKFDAWMKQHAGL